MEEQNKPKGTDRLTDKAFSRLVITSVFGILICIACLCSTTFAWFSDSAPSNQNEIKMADECLLTVEVTREGVALQNIENGVELEAGSTYVVTLTLPANTASGYCLIGAGGVTYRTDYIARHEEAAPKTVTFDLQVETTQEVIFTPRWGIYTQESDVGGGEVLLLPGLQG